MDLTAVLVWTSSGTGKCHCSVWERLRSHGFIEGEYVSMPDEDGGLNTFKVARHAAWPPSHRCS